MSILILQNVISGRSLDKNVVVLLKEVFHLLGEKQSLIRANLWLFSKHLGLDCGRRELLPPVATEMSSLPIMYDKRRASQ